MDTMNECMNQMLVNCVHKSGTNGKCLEVGASGRILETVPATPDPLHVTFDGAGAGNAAAAAVVGAASTTEGTSAVRPANPETERDENGASSHSSESP